MDKATLTRIGGRTVNEDSAACASRNGSGFIAVCDGLGGHGFGEVASATAVEAAMKAYDAYDGEEDFLARAAEAVQKAVLDKQDESLRYHDMRKTRPNRYSIGSCVSSIRSCTGSPQ